MLSCARSKRLRAETLSSERRLLDSSSNSLDVTEVRCKRSFSTETQKMRGHHSGARDRTRRETTASAAIAICDPTGAA
ncbi:MAG: hypothetical protein C4334_12440 [Pyrinomonas sp.]